MTYTEMILLVMVLGGVPLAVFIADAWRQNQRNPRGVFSRGAGTATTSLAPTCAYADTVRLAMETSLQARHEVDELGDLDGGDAAVRSLTGDPEKGVYTLFADHTPILSTTHSHACDFNDGVNE